MVNRSAVLRTVAAVALSIALLPSLPGAADVRAVGLGPLRVVSMASGDLHTCAILDTGQVSCWGQGFDGQLGDDAGSLVLTDEQVACLDEAGVGEGLFGRCVGG